ncbi:response regulator [Desulfonauticus submarinus]
MEKTILIIDDEIAFVDVLKKRLEKRKFQVDVAYSGQEGIQLLRKKDFDLVLLDLKMEDMDGLDVLNILRRMIPNLPVILLTGHASEETIKKGMLLGAHAYVLKPCDLEELLECIKQILNKGGSKCVEFIKCLF